MKKGLFKKDNNFKSTMTKLQSALDEWHGLPDENPTSNKDSHHDNQASLPGKRKKSDLANTQNRLWLEKTRQLLNTLNEQLDGFE